MGIKNLFKNLESIDIIKEKKFNIINRDIFIDFDCLFHMYAHVSGSDQELYEYILRNIYRYKKNNTIHVFFDSGTIKKKDAEHLKRHKSSIEYFTKMKNRLKDKYNMTDNYTILKEYASSSTQTLLCNPNSNCIIENEILLLESNISDQYKINHIDIRNSDTQTDLCYENMEMYDDKFNNPDNTFTKEIDIIEEYSNEKKNIYSIRFNLDRDKKIELKKRIIKSLNKQNINILTQNDIDAELYMIIESKKIFNDTNKWPICYSKDQDILALTVINNPNKKFKILYNNILYRIKNNNISVNTTILSLIFNKSDYFGGIYKYPFTTKKAITISRLDNIYLEDYSIESLKLLCKFAITNTMDNNKIKKKENVNIEYIDKYLIDISYYITCNLEFYNSEYNKSIHIDDFISYLYF
jgi:hypothetical protein